MSAGLPPGVMPSPTVEPAAAARGGNAAAEHPRIAWRTLTMVGALALIWITFSMATDGTFLSPRNLSLLARQMAVTSILATGMVLVIVAGEMSRTPKMNDGFGGQPAGRDHWSSAISLVMGGGGVKGGRIVGKTDPRGEYIVERPVTVQDLHATIYHALGIDPYTSFLNTAGRPVPAVDDGSPIKELF